MQLVAIYHTIKKGMGKSSATWSAYTKNQGSQYKLCNQFGLEHSSRMKMVSAGTMRDLIGHPMEIKLLKSTIYYLAFRSKMKFISSLQNM